MSYTRQIIMDALSKHGLAPEQVQVVAETILTVQVAAGVLQVRVIEAVDRDAKVYRLRGERMTSVVIGERMGMSKSEVFKIIRRHSDRRRAVLRLIA